MNRLYYLLLTLSLMPTSEGCSGCAFEILQDEPPDQTSLNTNNLEASQDVFIPNPGTSGLQTLTYFSPDVEQNDSFLFNRDRSGYMEFEERIYVDQFCVRSPEADAITVSDIGVFNEDQSSCEPIESMFSTETVNQFQTSMANLFHDVQYIDPLLFLNLQDFLPAFEYVSHKAYYEPCRDILHERLPSFAEQDFISSQESAAFLLDETALAIADIEHVELRGIELVLVEHLASDANESVPENALDLMSLFYLTLPEQTFDEMITRIHSPIVPLAFVLSYIYSAEQATEQARSQLQEVFGPTLDANMTAELQNLPEVRRAHEVIDLMIFSLELSMGSWIVGEVLEQGCNSNIETPINNTDGLVPLHEYGPQIFDPNSNDQVISFLQARTLEKFCEFIHASAQ